SGGGRPEDLGRGCTDIDGRFSALPESICTGFTSAGSADSYRLLPAGDHFARMAAGVHTGGGAEVHSFARAGASAPPRRLDQPGTKNPEGAVVLSAERVVD